MTEPTEDQGTVRPEDQPLPIPSDPGTDVPPAEVDLEDEDYSAEPDEEPEPDES